MMKFEDFKAVDLRKAVRHFIPELRGAGAIGNTGSREQCIAALVSKGIMTVEVEEYLAASAKIGTPEAAEADAAVKQPVFEGFEKAEKVIEAEEKKDEQPAAVPAPMAEAMAAAPKAPTVASPAASKTDAEKKLELLQELLGGGKKEIDESAVRKIVAAMLNEYSEKLQGTLADQAAQTAKNVAEIIEKMQAKGVKKIEVKLENGDTKKLGICHHETEKVAKAVARAGRNVLLVGPAGSGKTTCCEKVAEILGLPFHAMSVGPETMKSDLLGFIDAAGNYHPTEIRRAFENGGLLLLDELDAGSAGSLTVLNALLANGYCAFPDGMVKRHENFRCIAAANTFGRGADRMYVGRNQLDAATLDRFKPIIDFDYDEAMERQVAGNDAWVDRVQAVRKRAFDLKARIVISPRASIMGASLLEDGFEWEEVENMVLWSGIDKALVEKLK